HQPTAASSLDVFNGSGWTRLRTRWTAFTEITLKGFFGVGIVEDGAVGTRDGAQFAPHAHILSDHFGTDWRDGDRLHRAGDQAPGFGALRAGIGRVTGMGFKGRNTNH